MRSCCGKIPRFRDVEFIAEEAIAIKGSARMEKEKRYLAKNIHLIEENRDSGEEREPSDWQVFPFRKTYRLKALLQLDRFEFVFNVFRALLGRNPNPEEMWTQVEVIRKNKLRKLTYIINLRGVEEGKAYNSSFRDADRGIQIFGRFVKIRNLGSIRDIEIFLKGSESIFSDTDDLEERFEISGPIIAIWLRIGTWSRKPVRQGWKTRLGEWGRRIFPRWRKCIWWMLPIITKSEREMGRW